MFRYWEKIKTINEMRCSQEDQVRQEIQIVPSFQVHPTKAQEKSESSNKHCKYSIL